VITHLESRGIALEVSEEAIEWLIARASGETAAGARPLRRAVQRYLEDAVSDYLISHRQGSDAALHAHVEGDHLVVASREGVCEQ
jgi:ATP-dependent Clp protease ATP-binding subunit ClpC